MHASWTEFVSASDLAPSPERYGHSLTTFNYDDILVVCFGGTSGAGVTSQVDTVWSWTVAKGWYLVSTSGPSPAHRAWHGAAAHGTSLYIFGGNRWEAQPGQKPTRSVHGDLWALDTETWTWRQILQPAGELWPASRSAMGMAAHGEGLLLYGGRGIGTGFLGDLWMFSPSTGRWAEVTPSPRLKSPQPRVLSTFVSTPFGVFLYGGARQVASTPNARAPLCDLWQLKLDDSKGSTGQPVYVWEDCNKVPMCAVEHTASAEDGSPPPATTAAAGERVVVGHDAHASAFVEPSHLVVWSGVLGRMPKRGMLASAPPPPQLTGNLFAIDLGAIDRGWSMVPAARLNAADSGVGPVLPRRWAAMSALGPGRAVVHGGLAEQRVLGQAAVLEIQEAMPSPRVQSNSSGGDSAATAAQPADLLGLDSTTAEPAARGPFPSGATSPTPTAPDGAQLSKAQSQSVDSPALGPMKSSSVMSAVLGGMRKGMETISSEAASVIQRVTNTGRPEGEPEDSFLPGQVRYSQPPPLASPSTSPGLQRGAAAFWGNEETSAAPLLSRDFIEGWLRANSSAAKNSVQVLVATTDRLTKPRLSQQPAAHSAAAASAADGRAAPSPSATAAASQATTSSHPLRGDGGGDDDGDDDGDGPMAAPSTPLTVQTGAGGGSEEEGEVESPVSLWISPSPTGPHSPLSVDRSSAFGSSRLELQAADEDARAVVDVMEEMLARVAERGALQSSHAGAHMHASGIGEEDFQFDKLPNAGVPPEEVPSVWPLGPPDGPPQRQGGSEATSSKAQEPADKDLPTAYVQDMLATDPVHELGLRVTQNSSSRLEFVSFSEAKTEMRRAACAWLLSVPCAECLRRKDVDALWTEYRRAAPNAMALFGKGSDEKLGTLMHLARKDLRMRDVPVLLSEFKQLRKLAPAKNRPG